MDMIYSFLIKNLTNCMTFKEFISAILEKIACKHDWERWQTVHVTEDWGGSYHIYHFRCNKCGKFKKVKSY